MFEKITENVENISTLPDTPTLSPEQLKREFDKGNKIIKEAFNKLIDDLREGGIGDTLPIGAVIEYPVSDNEPNNWLLCDGREVSRSEYDELFEVLGTTWGEGDGSTTFNLPDRQGLVAIGAGTHTDSNGEEKVFVLGQEYGEYSHKLTSEEMPSHSHHIRLVGEGSGQYGYNVTTLNIGSKQDSYTDTTGGDKPHNNIQPSIATNYIIKAKQSSGTTASVIQEEATPNKEDVFSSEAVMKIVKGTILFEDEEGTTGDITLNDTVQNYSSIKISFQRGTGAGTDKIVKTQEFYNVNNNEIILESPSSASAVDGQDGINQIGITYARYSIKEKLVKRVHEYAITFRNNSANIYDQSATNIVAITKVIGYRY